MSLIQQVSDKGIILLLQICIYITSTTDFSPALSIATYYHSVPGKCPRALKHNSRYWPAWALTRDINSIRLYRSCYIDPLKCGTRVLTQDTTVYIHELAWSAQTCVVICAYIVPVPVVNSFPWHVHQTPFHRSYRLCSLYDLCPFHWCLAIRLTSILLF